MNLEDIEISVEQEKFEKQLGHYEKEPLRVFFDSNGKPFNVIKEYKAICEICDVRISEKYEPQNKRYISKSKIKFN